MDKADQLIIFPVLKNNCYFLHSENILPAAVSDSDQVIRTLAVDKIIEACLNVATNGIQTFDKNNIILNLAAKSYFEMIDWKQCLLLHHRHCCHIFLMSNLLMTNQLYCLIYRAIHKL